MPISKPFYEDLISSGNISLDLSERPLAVSEETHCAVIRRIIKFYKRMLSDQEKVDEIWKPAGEWKNYNDEKSFLYQEIINENIHKIQVLLRNFWRNQLGLIVKEYARFEVLEKGSPDDTSPFLHSIYRNYFIWRDIYNLPAARLKLETEIGNPWGCIIDDVLVTPKAVRYHHNTIQIKNLLKACGGSTVAEIGAGYGALCYYLLKEIPGVKYIDYDLPETLVLSAYNLLLSFPAKKIFLYGEEELSAETISQYDVLLLPNYVISGFNDKSIDVFFNSFSLSEMVPAANAEYIKQIGRLTKGFFLHNNMDRKGVVNRGFERIPASAYPVTEEFLLLCKTYDLFHSHSGDYKEFLYKLK